MKKFALICCLALGVVGGTSTVASADAPTTSYTTTWYYSARYADTGRHIEWNDATDEVDLKPVGNWKCSKSKLASRPDGSQIGGFVCYPSDNAAAHGAVGIKAMCKSSEEDLDVGGAILVNNNGSTVQLTVSCKTVRVVHRPTVSPTTTL